MSGALHGDDWRSSRQSKRLGLLPGDNSSPFRLFLEDFCTSELI